MTDYYDSFLVILKLDLRDDEAEATINAIRQIKGVLDVQPHIADTLTRSIAEQRVKADLRRKIAEALK